MKSLKRLQTLLMVCVFLTALTGCGGGITEERYNEVCSERDALQAQLQEMQQSQPSEEQYDAVRAERDALQAQLQEMQQSQPSEEQYDAVRAERDALQMQLRETQSRLAAKEDKVSVRISGSFTAQVRHLIPDYVAMPTSMPQVAVITLFQAMPFALYVGDLALELKEGEIYVFEIDPQELEITVEEYERIAGGGMLADDALWLYNLRVAGAKIAQESDYGLETTHLVIEKLQ